MSVGKPMNSLDEKKLLEFLREYLPQITEHLTKTSGIRPSLEKQLLSLFDAFEKSFLTNDPVHVDQILENWIGQYTEAEMPQIVLDLTSWLRSIETACIAVIREYSSELDVGDKNLSFTTSEWFFYAQERLIRLGFRKYIDQQTKAATEIQAMLEKLDRSKSNFISIAAHELKTPLTIIEGYSMMLNDLLTENDHLRLYSPYIEGIQKGTERLKQTIQDMIDVSLIDSRMLLLTFQPCLLNRLIETVVKEMKKKSADRNLLIQWRPISGINEMIYLDEVRLAQALRNVIENAIKYTPDGGRVSIYGRKLSGFIEILVEDTGIGVDPEDQPFIFEKFSQLGQVLLHSTGKSKFKGGGAGLGLPIAKGILEAHGGTIWMESEGYDEVRCPGSIFHLMIPIYTEPPKASAQIFSAQQTRNNQSLANG